MSRRDWLRAAAGAAFWLCFLGWFAQQMTARRLGGGESALSSLGGHFLRADLVFDVRFPQPLLFEVGDGVLLDAGANLPDPWHPVGEVMALLDDNGRPLPEAETFVQAVRVRIFDARWSGLHDDMQAAYFKVPAGAADWVFRQLMTAERSEAVVKTIHECLLPHREALVGLVAPVLRNFLIDCEQTLVAETPAFLNRHRADIDSILASAEKDLGRERLLGLFDAEVWPSVRMRLEPVLSTIGDEIWARLPLWGLTWRIVYQALPLTENDYFERRWNEFLTREVVPILKSHAGEFVEVSRQVAREAVENPQVRLTLRGAGEKLLSDPSLLRLATDFVAEVFLDNPRFRTALDARLRSAELNEVLRFIVPRLEAAVRQIGDTVLGTQETGLTAEFAHVLRSQVLDKGSRHIRVWPGTPGRPLFASGAVLQGTVLEAGPAAARAPATGGSP